MIQRRRKLLRIKGVNILLIRTDLYKFPVKVWGVGLQLTHDPAYNHFCLALEVIKLGIRNGKRNLERNKIE